MKEEATTQKQLQKVNREGRTRIKVHLKSTMRQDRNVDWLSPTYIYYVPTHQSGWLVAAAATGKVKICFTKSHSKAIKIFLDATVTAVSAMLCSCVHISIAAAAAAARLFLKTKGLVDCLDCTKGRRKES